MAGVDVGGGKGGRRKALDSDINMIPMIDLLMVTISFLLITAAWTHTARLDSSAQVPGPRADAPPEPVVAEKQLDIEMSVPDRFVLAWKQGATTIESIEVPRREVVRSEGTVDVVQFPELAARIESEWRAKGQHARPADPRLDQAVLHTDDHTQFKYIVGVLDAIDQTRRDVMIGGKTGKAAVFNVTFAVN